MFYLLTWVGFGLMYVPNTLYKMRKQMKIAPCPTKINTDTGTQTPITADQCLQMFK
jgi:hypothetical protein